MDYSLADSETATLELPIAFIDAVSATTTIEQVMDVGSRWLSKIVGCSRCSIAYLDDGKLIAQEFRSHGRFTPVPTQELDDVPSYRLKVLKTGLPVHLDRAMIEAAENPVMQRLAGVGIHTILIAPMFSSGEVVGTLSACRLSTTAFTARECREVVAMGKWIAAQVQLMRQLSATRRLAETDILTGLANRGQLMRHLARPGALTPDPKTGLYTGLLAVDLDRFKIVNDSQGHTAGDTMLVAAANGMRDLTDAGDLVARTGGDEFVIVTCTDPGGHHLADLAAALIKAISRPVDIDGVTTWIGASIGTAIAATTDCTIDTLMDNADLALYEAKRAGRGRAQAYIPKMRARHAATQRLMTDLQHAANYREFEPYFQPQVDLSTGQIAGVEILARWPHPTLGVLGPDDFMDLAIEGHLLDQIDEIVRVKGLSALRRMRHDGWRVPKIAFNASASALRDAGLADRLLRDVHRQGLDPSDMVLEMRETSLIDSTDGAVGRNVARIATAGFNIALDDFGTGCAAISNLTAPGIGAIKLDRTLVARLPDSGGECILRAIINLAHELGLKVTACGVETSAQFGILQRLGCSTAQGFGVARPMPLDTLMQFLTDYGKAPTMQTG